MFWLFIVCIGLAAAVIGLCIKIHLLRKSADEIGREFAFRLEHDTNTLIAISSRDRHMRRLAGEINGELRLLRGERQLFQQGDRELKESIVNLAHDLRTPLTAMCGYLELSGQALSELSEVSELSELSGEGPRAAALREALGRYLGVIGERTESLKQLTEELFRYTVAASGDQELFWEEVVLNRAVEESISVYYGALKRRGIRPEISLPEEPVVRRLDQNALLRILENVLSNVVKYSDGDLRIHLSEGGEIVFSNHASGLSEVQVSRLFNRFYTVESNRWSTGVGLSIARALTERMKGKISACYREGVLSICILFPEREI